MSGERESSRSRREGSTCPGSMVYRIAFALLSLQTASAGLIDMDTPLDRRTTTSLVDGSVYHVVMSDEFNTPNRSLKDGHDPIWTALDKSDDDSSSAGGGSQQFYNSSFATTEDGYLKVKTQIGKTEWNRFDHVNKEWKLEHAYYKSAMIQSWEKFCFTGGIVEIDVILPGDPYVGGLWPALWMLGNLGRATYESSTNNIWPWSFNTCDRKLQQSQDISACNEQNHYGMNAFQGRGATEIDILEVMTGFSDGPLAGTDPPIELPYCDMTLQVAPGVPSNRPSNSAQPIRENMMSKNGHTELLAQVWYDGLELHANTSINPFFYGTYLGETKKNEPVTRTKAQAFQADAIGAAHQLTPAHFTRAHTFRVEWQPGPGGRIDWFTKAHKINETFSMEGDGLGTDWTRVFGLKDNSLKDLMGSQIPEEPSYLIFNTAVSSTWGFPYTAPESCTKCYDCDDPKCACTFAPGFCKMLRKGDVAMKIDSVRVYQSRDPEAHVGNPHTLGCDPPEFPTRGWIKGHEYRYMRNPPFSLDDDHPLRPVQRGGGKCKTDSDCGGDLKNLNLTEIAELPEDERKQRLLEAENQTGRGRCVTHADMKAFFSTKVSGKICKCSPGFTGPRCLAQAHTDDSPSAWEITRHNSLLEEMPNFQASPFMIFILVALCIQLVGFLCYSVAEKKKTLTEAPERSGMRRPLFHNEHRIITGTSV